MGEHSLEPWKVSVSYEEPARPGIDSSNERTIVTYGLDDDDADVYGDTPEQALANARRIVACVNACRGIADADLARGVVAKPAAPGATPGWPPTPGDVVRIKDSRQLGVLKDICGESLRGGPFYRVRTPDGAVGGWRLGSLEPPKPWEPRVGDVVVIKGTAVAVLVVALDGDDMKVASDPAALPTASLRVGDVEPYVPRLYTEAEQSFLRRRDALALLGFDATPADDPFTKENP